MKRILLVDDHEVVRKGLRSLLTGSPDWEVCAEAADGMQAVSLALTEKPDLIVMDINMPAMSGIEATREILARLPETRVLILSAFESANLIREMLASGARGYVLKSDVGEDLVRAVEALASGGIYFTSGVSDYVLQQSRRTANPAASPETAEHAPLTRREVEVLQQLAEGRSNKEIANALNIAVRTVETHRANLMMKLNAHSLSDLVRFAIQHQIIKL